MDSQRCHLCRKRGAGLAVAGAGLLGWVAYFPAPATAASALVLGWSAIDIWKTTVTSPLTLLGEIALWPLHFRPLGLLGVVVGGFELAALGVKLGPGLSLEAAERRSALVGALRFAATTRELRPVVVLRRQLTGELPRQRPWLRLPARSRRGGSKGAVSRRDLQGMLRWPAIRWGRMIVLAALAGLCVRGVWAGTAPPDHGGRPLHVGGRPGSHRRVGPGGRLLRALSEASPPAQLSPSAPPPGALPGDGGHGRCRAVGGAGLGHPRLVLEIGGATLLPAALAAVAGAAVSILREPAKMGAGLGLAPEMAGGRQFVRELLPPVITLAGLVPVLVARAASHHHGEPPFDAAVNVAFLVLLVPIAAFGWVHGRGRFSAALDAAKEDAAPRRRGVSPAPPPPAPPRRFRRSPSASARLRQPVLAAGAGWTMSPRSGSPNPSSPRHAPVLTLRALSKSFGDAPAVDQVSLVIGEGEHVVMVRTNGSGKTTLLRIVAGLLQPSSGEVSIMGAAPDSTEARSVTAYLPDNPVLYDDLSVNEHLYFVARMHGEDGSRAPELVKRLGLENRAEDLPSRLLAGCARRPVSPSPSCGPSLCWWWTSPSSASIAPVGTPCWS